MAGSSQGGASSAGSGAGGNVATGTKVVTLAGGNTHLCAVMDGGSVSCWGANGSGQLGNDTPNNDHCQTNPCATRPVKVKGLSTAISVALGQSHSCALLGDGSVACWGDNSSGQLGRTTQGTTSSAALAVPGLSGVVGLAAGGAHTCAIVAGGGVKCWGGNSHGQLGTGMKMNSASPTPVMSSASDELSGAIKIVAGVQVTCALLTGGVVECWGGPLGFAMPGTSSTYIESAVPIAVPGITNASDIFSSANSDTWAIFTDGATKCWGGTQYGGCGGASPSAYPGLSMVKAIAPSYGNGRALLTGGTVQCWGADPMKPSVAPVTVTGLSEIVAIAASASVDCALTMNGTVKCWGFGLYGDLGNGSTANAGSPVSLSF